MMSIDKQKWLDIAEVIDALRVVPRILLFVYFIFLFVISYWFTQLSEPSNQHMAFITALIGILPFLVSIYANSSRRWTKND